MKEMPGKYLPRVAFWLVPQRQQRQKLQSLIMQLAGKFSAPVFVPHVTIYSCRRTSQQQELTAVVSLADRCPAVSMCPVGLDGRGRLTQALFIKFLHDPMVAEIYQWLDTCFSRLSKFKFEPHLSLLYQELTASQRDALTREITLDLKEIIFDELWAVAIPEQLVAADDLDGWQILVTCRLASAQNTDTINDAELEKA